MLNLSLINSKVVTGDTSKQDREAALRLFTTNDAPCECRFLIATFAIIKEGLNLVGANHLIQMDPPETHAEDRQSQDRYWLFTSTTKTILFVLHLECGESQQKNL